MINQNIRTDAEDRVVVTTEGIPLEMTGTFTEDNSAAILAAVESIRDDKLPDAVPAAPGQLAVPVKAFGTIAATQSGMWTVGVSSLPENAATSDNQSIEIGHLFDINAKLEDIQSRIPPALISGLFGVQEANSLLIFGQLSQINGKLPPNLGPQLHTQSLSVTFASDQGSIPLGAGAATSALQTSGNASLTSIDGKLTGVATAANQGTANGFLGTIASATDIALSALKTAVEAVRDRLPSAFGAGGGVKVDGSGTALPVSGAFWQATQPVSAASLPLPTGAATSALQGGGLPSALVGGRLDTNNGAWLGSTAPTVGQKTMANSIPVALASDQTSLTFQPSSSPSVGNYMSVRLTKDGANYADQMASGASQSAPSTALVFYTMTRGRAYSGVSSPGLTNDVHVDTWGRVHTAVAGNAPIADATTDVYSILLGTSGPSAITGAVVAKASAGRVKRYVLKYTGASGTTYVQIHKAATTGAAATSTLLEPGMPCGTGSPTVIFEPSIDLPCTSGIVIAFSSTQDTYTAAGAETGTITLYGA